MRSIGIGLILLLTVLSARAQQATGIRFNENTHDFGKIREENSPFEYEFTFTNESADTIQITDVKASCGCTIPSWTSEKVAPGGSGHVRAKYNADREGTFSKSLQVTFNGRTEPHVLYIQGTVLPADLHPEQMLPTAIGSLHLKYRSLNMGKVLTRDEPASSSFEVYNGGEQAIHVDSVWAPAHVQVKLVPDTLAPGAIGQLLISYEAKAVGRLGFQSENITLFTNDGNEPVKAISLYTTIAEYFPPMTDEEIKKAAHLKIYQPVFDFERLQKDSVYKTTYTITNSGQSLLQIRQLETNCSCVIATIDKTEIKPGKEATVTVTFNTSERLGNQQKSVTIYTNDPIAPAQRLTFKAYIETAD